jgi:class 3 adenylate cyclase
VNLSQRLQQFASAGETVLSEATLAALSRPVQTVSLGAQMVKGRETPVTAYKIINLAAPATAVADAAARAGATSTTEMTTRTGA